MAVSMLFRFGLPTSKNAFRDLNLIAFLIFVKSFIFDHRIII